MQRGDKTPADGTDGRPGKRLSRTALVGVALLYAGVLGGAIATATELWFLGLASIGALLAGVVLVHMVVNGFERL